MKGLQGELEETLGGIKLSIATIEKLFQSYSSCCSDLLPTLFTVGAGLGAGLPAPAPLCQRPRPPPGQGAPALGVPPLPRLQENGLLPAQAEDHRGDSTAQGMGLGAPGQTGGANTALAARGTQQHGGAPGWAGPGVDAFGNIGSRGTAQPWCCSLGTSSAREWGAGAGHAAEPDLEAVGAHQELYEISIEFLKLEKAEMGGARGNILGSQVFQIYEEVSELVRGFADCKYDPLDPAEEVSE